ncbi:MAG: CRISPR system precrRNA processing endoribonuclease RAMP protein Cas6 [Bacillota bacterium]
MFEHFRLARFRFSIKAGPEGLVLPPYKGATFRGGFGSVFRRMTCAVHRQDCQDCTLREECPYAYIFETGPPPHTDALSKYESIPRPFVLEPPLETKRDYLPGEMLHFHLILIGRAGRYLPYFIIVFREMGEAGLGQGRRPFSLAEVAACGLEEEVPIYAAETGVVKNLDLSYSGKQLLERLPEKAARIRLAFDTPVQLKDQGKTVSRPDFHIFFRQALRRISSLAYFHQGEPLRVDYPALAERSRQVALTENTTRRHDWERYSRRQQQRLNMGGLVGTVVYEGALDEFLPFLVLGEQVHVGKNTVFGLGKYRIYVQ